MRDVVFISIVVAFFALATAYVGACARILGPEERVTPLTGDPEAPGDEVEVPGVRGAPVVTG